MTRINQARALLVAGAIVMLATAAFHSTGLPMVSGWFEDQRQGMLRLLWMMPVLDWGIVAGVWLLAARAPSHLARSFVLATAVIPAVAGASVIFIAGPSHPGGWMLVVAALLGVGGASRLEAPAANVN